MCPPPSVSLPEALPVAVAVCLGALFYYLQNSTGKILRQRLPSNKDPTVPPQERSEERHRGKKEEGGGYNTQTDDSSNMDTAGAAVKQLRACCCVPFEWPVDVNQIIQGFGVFYHRLIFFSLKVTSPDCVNPSLMMFVGKGPFFSFFYVPKFPSQVPVDR